MRKDLRRYRLATDYAEYGTLAGLLTRFTPNKFFLPEGEGSKNQLEFLENSRENPDDPGIQEAWKDVPKLPLRFPAELFKALVLGLTHITNRGIVRRDLNPDNILLAKPGEESDFFLLKVKPLIADFGLALPMDVDGIDYFNYAGAYPTLAPEQMMVPASLHETTKRENQCLSARICDS